MKKERSKSEERSGSDVGGAVEGGIGGGVGGAGGSSRELVGRRSSTYAKLKSNENSMSAR